MKEITKKLEKGITLIALVITIIVLLILAGVTISMLTGENGIVTKAIQSKEKTQIAEIDEKIKLAMLELEMHEDSEESTSGLDIKNKIEKDLEKLGYKIEEGEISVGGYKINILKKMAEYSENTWLQAGVEVSNGDITLLVGQSVTGYSVTVNGDTIGDWAILGVENGSLLITTISNHETITLGGNSEENAQKSWVSAVSSLNIECDKYNDGKIAVKARSINVEDINRVTNYKPEQAKCFEGEVYEYSNQVKYTLQSDGKIHYQSTVNKNPISDTSSDMTTFIYWTGIEWKRLQQGESKILNCTRYKYYPQTLTTSGSGNTIKNQNNSEKAYALIFSNTFSSYNNFYALASNYFGTFSDCIVYGVYAVANGCVDKFDLYVLNRGNSHYSIDVGVRPVILLNSNVQITSEGVLLN